MTRANSSATIKLATHFAATTFVFLGCKLLAAPQALAAADEQAALNLTAQAASDQETSTQESTGQDSSSTDQGSTDQSDTSTDTSTDTNTDTDTDTDTTVTKISGKIVVLKGTTQKLNYGSSYGTLQAKSSNKNVVKVTSTGKNKFKVAAKKNGSATITFSSKTLLAKYKIVVAAGNSFVSKWVKNAATQLKKSNKNVKDQLLAASAYIVDNFSYANIYDTKTVISKMKGNCHSAGIVLAKIYKAMGYKATVRYAANDKMSRYPSNVNFGSQHYNVKVVAKGKTYYLDATPGSGLVYLSSSKKPLAEYVNLGGSWAKVM